LKAFMTGFYKVLWCLEVSKVKSLKINWKWNLLKANIHTNQLFEVWFQKPNPQFLNGVETENYFPCLSVEWIIWDSNIKTGWCN
jgi:hypothetical protein